MNVSGFYIVKGDSTCDGRISMEDLISIQAHILGVSALTGDAFTGADTNSDNVVNGRDLANVNLHLLGVSMITGLVNK